LKYFFFRYINFLTLLLLITSGILHSQTYYWEKLADDWVYDILVDKYGHLYYTGDQGVYRSYDSGNSWVLINNGLNGIWLRCLAIDSSNVIYGGTRGQGGVYKTTNNGDSWTLTNLSVDIYSLEIGANNSIWAGGEDSIYFSSDAGITWVSSYVDDYWVWDIALTQNNSIFAATNEIYRSTNNGLSWEAVYSSRPPSQFFIDSSASIYAAMNYLGVMKSTDNGESWDTISTQNLESIYRNNNGVFYGAWFGVYESTDNGITWVYRGVDSQVKPIAFLDSLIFVGSKSFGSGLYKYDPSIAQYIGNNFFPLGIGNKWQYYYSATNGARQISKDEVVKDSVINNLTYYKLSGSKNDWVRYSEEDKKLFIYWNDSDYVYMNYILNESSTFSHMDFNSHTIRNVSIIAPGEYSVFDSSFFYRGYYYIVGNIFFDSYTFRYAESLGEIYYRIHSEGPGGSSVTGIRKIIRAIINDGDTTRYLSDHQKPLIDINPVLITNDFSLNLNFTVDHAYTYSNSNGFFNFIDTVLLNSYYFNGDSTVSNLTILLNNETNTINYSVDIELDSTLMKNDYDYFYGIYAVDKGIVRENSLSPDSGFYKLIYDTTATLVPQSEPEVLTYYLKQNYPNPFNPTTSIQYAIIKRQWVTLKVFDLLGNELATLLDEEKPAGNYKITFNGAGLSSGIYFYRLKAGSFIQTKKMILLK